MLRCILFSLERDKMIIHKDVPKEPAIMLNKSMGILATVAPKPIAAPKQITRNQAFAFLLPPFFI